jgi:Glycosyltransferase like family 2
VALVHRLRRAVSEARRQSAGAPPAERTGEGRQMEEVRGALATMEERLSGLSRRLEEVQQLAARTYEQGFDYPGRLAALRADPRYEDAYVEDPLISVVLPTYNRAVLLCERGLPSVLRQTYAKLEVIVVGNACTDDTVERVEAIGDSRVRVVNLPFQEPEPDDDDQRWHNSGTVPINHGMALAAGSWIAIQHDDDEWDAEYLEQVLAAAQAARAEIAYCRSRIIHAPTNEDLDWLLGEFPPRLTQFATQFSVFHAGLRLFGYDRACALMDEPNDWNFGRRLWEAGVRFHFVPDTLGSYYLRPRTEEGREWIAERLEWLRSTRSARAAEAAR